MSTVTAPAATRSAQPSAAAPRRPRLLHPTYLRIELRRMLRNRRSAILTLGLPALLLLLFGTQAEYRTMDAGRGNVTFYVTVSMSLYGAMLATSSGGASVAVERAQGWSRQLRMTPLRPVAYVLTKIVAAMTLGLASVLVVDVVGALSGASAEPWVWVATGVAAWLGSSIFAAFGLFLGFVFPAENVMQVLGPGIAVLAFAGGLFMPLGDGVFATIAQLTPLYGLAELTRAPLTGDGVTLASVVNVTVWAGLFVTGAVWRFRGDTARA